MSGKKIKVALCISGEPRWDFETFASIYKTFLTSSKYNTDVFIHSLKQPTTLDLYQPKNYLIEPNIENFLIEDTLSKIKNPSEINFRGYCDNTILMYYSIYKCFSLINDKYDIYIRLRFDSLFEPNINFSSIIEDILKNKYEIFIPSLVNIDLNFSNQLPPLVISGYSDRFAIGNFNSMNIYSNTFLSMVDIAQKTKVFNAHTFLYNKLNSNNIKVEIKQIKEHLLRNVQKSIQSF
tara:strand:+ start:32 stop:739 length:708 start_codon:yes stop_codon:yes gene_type:complete